VALVEDEAGAVAGFDGLGVEVAASFGLRTTTAGTPLLRAFIQSSAVATFSLNAEEEDRSPSSDRCRP
jgi:hypothetical protein